MRHLLQWCSCTSPTHFGDSSTTLVFKTMNSKELIFVQIAVTHRIKRGMFFSMRYMGIMVWRILTHHWAWLNKIHPLRLCRVTSKQSLVTLVVQHVISHNEALLWHYLPQTLHFCFFFLCFDTNERNFHGREENKFKPPSHFRSKAGLHEKILFVWVWQSKWLWWSDLVALMILGVLGCNPQWVIWNKVIPY